MGDFRGLVKHTLGQAGGPSFTLEARITNIPLPGVDAVTLDLDVCMLHGCGSRAGDAYRSVEGREDVSRLQLALQDAWVEVSNFKPEAPWGSTPQIQACGRCHVRRPPSRSGPGSFFKSQPLSITRAWGSSVETPLPILYPHVSSLCIFQTYPSLSLSYPEQQQKAPDGYL